jgi:hypothetical protein
VKAGSVAQVVEYLPSKCQALSSNLSTEKREREGRIEREKENMREHF